LWEPLNTALLERGFAAQDFPVIPDIFPKLIVLPSPGDLTGIVVIVRHRSFSGCGYPQRRQDNSLDRPEIDKAALVDEIDGLFGVGKTKPPLLLWLVGNRMLGFSSTILFVCHFRFHLTNQSVSSILSDRSGLFRTA